jgi:probable phosphoglycerate mutase
VKWPATLTFIRHGESAYNVLKARKEADVAFQGFKGRFDREFADASDDRWVSDGLLTLARRVWKTISVPFGEYDTPLTQEGFSQAVRTGERLHELIEVPDIVYVSPYIRTMQTLEGLTASWPALKGRPTVPEERIREQEHGLSAVYSDWRVYFVFNPLQGLLYKVQGDYEYRFLNGENKPDVRDRSRGFLSTLIREHAERKVLVISHHLTLLSFRANLERWGREEFIETDHNDKPINCGVTIYKGNPQQGKNGRLSLEIYNKRLY